MPIDKIKDIIIKKVLEYGIIGILGGFIFYYLYTSFEESRVEDKRTIEYYRGMYNKCSEERLNESITLLREVNNTMRESNRLIRKHGSE
jgi:hypothetical protein